MNKGGLIILIKTKQPIESISHPGKTLKKKLEEQNMSQKNLSLRIDVTEPFISRIISGQKGISISFAKKLEYALNIDANYWIDLQNKYELDLADMAEIKNITKEETTLINKNKEVIDYLDKSNLLNSKASEIENVISLRKLLKVSDLNLIPKVLAEEIQETNLKKEIKPFALFVWLRICELITTPMQNKDKFVLSKLKSRIPFFRRIMFANASEIQSLIKTNLEDCGINYTLAPYFFDAPVRGLVKNNSNGSLNLIMTNRHTDIASFLFSFFHLLGHIINNDINNKFLDYTFTKDQAEDEANSFAENTMVNQEAFKKFLARNDYSTISIKNFCKQENIPSYIFVYRLEREDTLNRI